MSDSNHNEFSGNIVENNTYVIHVYSGWYNNTVHGNHVLDNYVGIYLQSSSCSYNIIYNNYFDNENNVVGPQAYPNKWNITKTLGSKYYWWFILRRKLLERLQWC